MWWEWRALRRLTTSFACKFHIIFTLINYAIKCPLGTFDSIWTMHIQNVSKSGKCGIATTFFRFLYFLYVHRSNTFVNHQRLYIVFVLDARYLMHPKPFPMCAVTFSIETLSLCYVYHTHTNVAYQKQAHNSLCPCVIRTALIWMGFFVCTQTDVI